MRSAEHQENEEEVEHVPSGSLDSASDQVNARVHFHVLDKP